jgi:predicted RNA binding protein YcfA (HicA-like mRNA interferase family)
MPHLSPVHYKALVRVFEKQGFILDRQEGDHLIYVHTGIKRPVVIPMYKAVPVFVIKNNLRTAGISRDEYLRLLKA